MGSSRRQLAAACACLLLLPAGAAAAAQPARSWAQPEIALVTARGIFDGPAPAFRPDDPLTAGALAQALAGLTGRPAAAPADAAAPVTLEQLDRALVGALGLRDAAYRFNLAARRAGLDPPRRFGAEAAARLLGLRLDHPPAEDGLERTPAEVASRAEAAYSFARVLRLAAAADGGRQRLASAAAQPADPAASRAVQDVKAAAAAFELPALSEWQRRVAAAAVSLIGYPYVWGGTGDGTAGFDCSGFIWRVYKLTAYPDEGGLADTVRGRTTMEMSGEVPKPARVGADDLQPGDVMFFGRGPRSKPAQVDHAAIYLGNGWLIQSSGYGVALAPFAGWYRDEFAWARRPLTEAGLA